MSKRFFVLFIFYFFILGQCNTFLISEARGQQEQGFSFDVNYRSLRIPVKISQNLLVVPMSINNSPPLNFILDTGVNTTILTEPIIAHLFSIDVSDLVYVLGLGSEGIIEAGMARNVTFSMQGITGRNMNMIVLPDGVLSFSEIFGFPVHGIIGYDFFREFPVEVNYRRKFIKVYQEPTYRIRRRSTVVPLIMENNKPYIEVSVMGKDSVKVDSLKLLVDMGATNPVFLNSSFKHLTPKRIPAYLGKGISGELVGEMGRLQYLEIEDFVIDAPLVAYPEEEFLTLANLKFEWQGILGGGILSRFRFIIDYGSKKLVMRKNNSFRKPFEHNMSGIEVIARGASFSEYFISYVRENSIAHEKDIRPGDQIIRIMNKQTARVTLDEIVGILNQEPGTVIHLEILRGDDIYRKVITLREDI
ncbi:MAG: aspartyl protease family protein [Bacteroidota bacterium]